jgi:predicted aconitase
LLLLNTHISAFSAAFGTSGASAMFHILGQTPEAPTLAAALQRSDVVSTRSEVRQHANENENETIKTVHLTRDVFVAAWRALDSGREKAHAPESVNGDNVQLVAVGNPHFSLEECEALAKLCDVEVEHGHAVKKGSGLCARLFLYYFRMTEYFIIY